MRGRFVRRRGRKPAYLDRSSSRPDVIQPASPCGNFFPGVSSYNTVLLITVNDATARRLRRSGGKQPFPKTQPAEAQSLGVWYETSVEVDIWTIEHCASYHGRTVIVYRHSWTIAASAAGLVADHPRRGAARTASPAGAPESSVGTACIALDAAPPSPASTKTWMAADDRIWAHPTYCASCHRCHRTHYRSCAGVIGGENRSCSELRDWMIVL